MRNFLIKILLKLVDIPDPKYTSQEQESLEKWLEYSWGHPGFELYTGRRNREMRTYMSGGLGAEAPPRDKYIRTIGQRDELLVLIAKAKLAGQKKK